MGNGQKTPSAAELVALVRTVSDEPTAVQEALGFLLAQTAEGRALVERAQELRPDFEISRGLHELWITLDADEKLSRLLEHPTFARAEEPFAWQLLLGFAPGDDGLYSLLVEVAARREVLLPADAPGRARLLAVRQRLEREWELERYADRRTRLERGD